MLKNFYVILFGAILLFLGHDSMAQNESDVVRYLNTSPFGSARTASMAGSFGALGGDVTTLSINPAGSAIYLKDEFSLTPGFTFNNTKSYAEGVAESESKNKFVFSNIGYVNSSGNRENRKAYASFGFVYNKTADFNRNSSISYMNNTSSMLYSFVNRANGIPVEDLSTFDPFSSYLAYEAYLIDEDLDSDNQYLTQPRYENNFPGVKQSNSIEESGSLGEITVNGSVALLEKFYFGASLSITMGNYTVNSNFVETTTVDTLLLNSYTFNYKQDSELSGANIMFGMIIKPEKWLRLGVSYQVPYKLTISDDFSTYLRSTWKDGDIFSYSSPDGYIQYELRNPGKLILSAAVISGFKGLINIDVEWMNYGNASFSSDDFDFSQENEQISQSLKSALNIRIGGELWLGRYNFRLGYAYRQNPNVYIGEEGKKFYNTISGGAGLLTDSGFFLNLSLSYIENGTSYYPYGKEYAPLINDLYANYELLLGLGIRF
jgi:hypothetical protein